MFTNNLGSLNLLWMSKKISILKRFQWHEANTSAQCLTSTGSSRVSKEGDFFSRADKITALKHGNHGSLLQSFALTETSTRENSRKLSNGKISTNNQIVVLLLVFFVPLDFAHTGQVTTCYLNIRCGLSIRSWWRNIRKLGTKKPHTLFVFNLVTQPNVSICALLPKPWLWLSRNIPLF